jgi:hypothetical protein
MKRTNLYLFFGYVLLIIVTTLTYLPALSQAKIYRDDWYYTVDRLKGGPETFQKMFEVDRPARGYFFEAYYRFFGFNPVPYHLTAFALRLLAVLLAFWLFRLLWPDHLEAALIMSLLFVIYPGYTRWMEGFEDQPKIFSLCLQVLSIILTLKAIGAKKVFNKVLLWTGSIITGLVYILLIDYAIGMELFRLLCVYIFLSQRLQGLPFRKLGPATIRAWLPAALIPGIYLFWRLFIFHNQRAATDIGLQLSVIAQDPVRGGWSWFQNLFRSTINQAVLAWWSPNFQNFFEQNNRGIFLGLLFAFMAAALTVGFLLWKRIEGDKESGKLNGALWVGAVCVVAGLLPVIIANRLVLFGAYSHYALPASLAAVVLVGGVIYSINSRYVRVALIAVLVLLAVMNHASAAADVLNEEQVISNFWHQVAWRAPNIKPRTTLNVNYPTVVFGEDYDAVNGPANFIYYPDPSSSIPVTYLLHAISQYAWTAKEILSGVKYDTGYRTHVAVVDPGNLLVMSQPATNACVHIVNSQYPWYSYNDPDAILLTGSRSKIDNVVTEGDSPHLDPVIFGPEPPHDWCYFFEKADLAAQNKDWATVLSLAKEAATQKLHPNERLEWMPFLQAYAVSGARGNFYDTLLKITSVTASPTVAPYDVQKVNEFNRFQTCNVLRSMENEGQEFSPEIQGVINTAICRQ